MANKIKIRYGFVAAFPWYKTIKIKKEIEKITYKYGFIKSNHNPFQPKMTLIAFKNKGEAIVVRNNLAEIIDVSYEVYAIQIKDGKAIDFKECQ